MEATARKEAKKVFSLVPYRLQAAEYENCRKELQNLLVEIDQEANENKDLLRGQKLSLNELEGNLVSVSKNID